MEESYEPREHDHLVEPVFGGLGARRKEPRPRWTARLVSVLRRWLGRLRR
jgi:hypothetical protein